MGETAKASPQGLEIVKQAALKKGWRKTSPALLDAASVSAATLKRFWRGVPVGCDSIQSICYAVGVNVDQVIESEDCSSQDDSFSAPSEPNTRQRLRQSLKNQLLASVRMLAIAGLTGIGKTTLARQIASDLEAKNYTIIHLTCDPTAPLTLASVVHAISKCACLDSFTFSLADLCDRLISQKYLFVIDNFEHLLGEDVTFGWGQLQSDIWQIVFQSILSAPACNSRFILTTQDTPNAIGTLYDGPANRWQIFALAGLTTTEQTTLFQNQLAKKTLTNTAQSAALAQIGSAYAGHPLALQTVAEDIAQSHQSNLLNYWDNRAADNLHSYSPRLQATLQPGLIQTVARLKSQLPEAFKLLCAISHHPKPITTTEGIQLGQPLELTPARCRELLDMLCDRAFLMPTIDQNRLHFHPHPLVRSLMLTQIHGPTHSAKTLAK